MPCASARSLAHQGRNGTPPHDELWMTLLRIAAADCEWETVVAAVLLARGKCESAGYGAATLDRS